MREQDGGMGWGGGVTQCIPTLATGEDPRLWEGSLNTAHLSELAQVHTHTHTQL